jgi:hypothetical protein
MKYNRNQEKFFLKEFDKQRLLKFNALKKYNFLSYIITMKQINIDALNKMNQVVCADHLQEIFYKKEDDLHKVCVQWFKMQYENKGIAILHHSPNENPSTDNRVSAMRYNFKMKELGRKVGFPDIEIFYKGKTLLIELKSETGKLSEAQKNLFPEFAKQGHTVHIVRSLEAFQQITNQFINQ